jgi:hypothetical protein
MSITAGHDCTHDNIGRTPKGQRAGYTTGSTGIRWTNADWDANPGAVRIDQDFAASDPSADVLDVENGAATFADCAPWAKKALADFANAVRPGQRRPAIYCSASNVTNVVNALIAGGVKSGVSLWVAAWSLGEQSAMREIASAGGPFPIIGVQYASNQFFDSDVWDGGWLADVSGNFARNPVKGLHVVRRGFTSITLAWDSEKNATYYTVYAAWRGKHAGKTVRTTTASARVGWLNPFKATYTFTVRAHPGGSTGSNATTKVTTR